MNSHIGVIFDMDGLLLDTEQTYLECFIEAQVVMGLEADKESYMACIGIPGAVASMIVAKNLDSGVSTDEFDVMWDAKIAEKLKHSVPVKKGVVELLTILRDKDIIMGVATSTPTPAARHHLELGGILDFLTCVVGRDLVTNRKPHPEPYLLAASKLGRDITNCYAFEDSETGTTAALASGAKVCQVPDLQQPSKELIARGHLIAPDLMTGARGIGLVT